MRIFSWVTKDTNIDFMKFRKAGYALSIALVVLSVACIVFKGFNYGIDFSGGILIELKSQEKINMEEVRKQLSGVELDDVNLQSIGESGSEMMIRAQTKSQDEKEQMKAVNSIKQILGDKYEYRRVELVGPQVGGELKKAGIIASVIAVLAITLYIWFRFEWQFALGAMVGLVHDLLVTVGFLSLFDFDISLTTVAAVLTLAGYSVNDKVVNYDRIRENLRKYKKMPQYELLNKSINDIFSRTILTGLTTLLASIALFIFGGDTLRSFSFTIVLGVIVGTYSSIYVSGTFLNLFNLRANQNADKAVNPSNIMGASKRIAEMLIETRGKTGKMQMAAVRFGNVLGSNGSVIPVFLSQIKEGGPITLTDRYIKRYFMSIPEAVRLVLQTGAFADSGEIFVLDMGEPVYIYDLACDLIRLNGLVPEQDIEIKVTGLRPGEKMFEELRYDTEAVDTTAHEGVFVNRLESIDRAAFDEKLARLRSLAFEEDVEGTTDMIFTIVPSEYRKKKESPEG